MPDEFTVRLEDEEFRKATERFGVHLSDLRPFWSAVVPLFIGWMRAQFLTEGAFGGQPWAALSQDYAERKAIARPGAGILVYDGDLRKAASHPKRIQTKDELQLSIPWAEVKGKPVDLDWHQEGTPRMPARPLLFSEPLPPAARASLEIAAEEYIGTAIKASGLG